MSPMSTGWIVFVCVFAGAVVGTLICRILPDHHLSDETKDVVKLGGTGRDDGGAGPRPVGRLGQGLLRRRSTRSFSVRQSHPDRHRALQQYGPPAQDARATFSAARSPWPQISPDGLWPADASDRSPPWAPSRTSRRRPSPSTPSSWRWYRPTTCSARSRPRRCRSPPSWPARACCWVALEHESSDIPVLFLVILTFWLVRAFCSPARPLRAPRNVTAISALLISRPLGLRRDLPDPGAGPALRRPDPDLPPRRCERPSRVLASRPPARSRRGTRSADSNPQGGADQ